MVQPPINRTEPCQRDQPERHPERQRPRQAAHFAGGMSGYWFVMGMTFEGARRRAIPQIARAFKAATFGQLCDKSNALRMTVGKSEGRNWSGVTKVSRRYLVPPCVLDCQDQVEMREGMAHLARRVCQSASAGGCRAARVRWRPASRTGPAKHPAQQPFSGRVSSNHAPSARWAR